MVIVLRINQALGGGSSGNGSEEADGDKVRLYFLHLLPGFVGVAN